MKTLYLVILLILFPMAVIAQPACGEDGSGCIENPDLGGSSTGGSGCQYCKDVPDGFACAPLTTTGGMYPNMRLGDGQTGCRAFNYNSDGYSFHACELWGSSCYGFYYIANRQQETDTLTRSSASIVAALRHLGYPEWRLMAIVNGAYPSNHEREPEASTRLNAMLREELRRHTGIRLHKGGRLVGGR